MITSELEKACVVGSGSSHGASPIPQEGKWVPAHVEMMGYIGMGNNPMVGATVAMAVAISQASQW